VEVRRIRADEWAELKELRLRALAEEPDAFSTVLAEEADLPDRRWRRSAREAASGEERFVALAVEGTGELVGLIRGERRHGRPEIAGVFSMWVVPRHRRRGVGRALLACTAGWATESGYATQRLHVVETNRAAIALYERAGFVMLEEREPLRAGSDLVLVAMERPL
jgi:ribosomal protein S18 acetylase RimI-like enzyme